MPNIQWFPGHMAKAKREILEKIKLVDIVLEILDARIPYSSRNPMMEELLANKPTLVILNKANLADKKVTSEWKNFFAEKGIKALDVDLIDDYNVKEIIPAIKEVLQDKINKSLERGLSNYKIRALVVGIPNVGKSTFINKVSKRHVAAVGDKPGVTKSQTWIKVNDYLDLLDTPGILWPKFEEREVALNLALAGSIKDEILPLDEVSSYALEFMAKYYPSRLEERYQIDLSKCEETLDIFDAIGKKRGCISRGNEIDYDRVINLIIYDLRHNKLGAMSYDRRSN